MTARSRRTCGENDASRPPHCLASSCRASLSLQEYPVRLHALCNCTLYDCPLQEYPVRLGSKDRQYTIAKFPQGLPGFRTGQGAQKEWTLHREKRTARELLRGQQDKVH